MKHISRKYAAVLLLALWGLPAGVGLAAQNQRTALGDGVYAVGLNRLEEESRFDELMQESQLIFVEAIVADKSLDTLNAAFYFDLLFEAMSDIEQLPMIDELQRLEFNRFLNASILFYENDSQTLDKIETSLTVSVLRDELSRYTRLLPMDLGAVARLDFDGEGRLPITHNDHVARIIEFFRTQGRRNMQAWLNRISRYAKIIEPILVE